MIISNYVPILKTKSSEMKAFKFLNADIKNKVTPLIELTTSRRTKLLPEGSIDKSMEMLFESIDKGCQFILDIASDEDLRNSELEEFYASNNGYEKWCSFLEKLAIASHKVIPTILLNLDSPHTDITQQAKRLSSIFGQIVLRLPVSDITPEDITLILGLVSEAGQQNIHLILDAGFIGQNRTQSIVTNIAGLMPAIQKAGYSKIRIASSSFPKLITSSGYGQQHHTGMFYIDEINLYEALKNQFNKITWLFSDYGSIHPVRYPTRGGIWIPRIDVPLLTMIYYYRYRREDGGYKRAAVEAFNDSRFSKLKCWGTKQIEIAAKDKPPGMSPAMWIAVRVNIHLTQQISRWN